MTAGNILDTEWMGGSVIPRASLDAEEKIKTSASDGKRT
jgi:hypothetical protein